ncbi:MAG: ABC transporter substrate-binding protein [Methyloligellaceae bacterium]|nr:MAG: ABC transporter substrate-binding protein [Alphaproteobacteria bacterium]
MKSVWAGIHRTVAGIGVAAVLAVGTAAYADPGVSPDKIVFGQAAALEGPASALGTGMQLGIKAAFAAANAKGGVKGRKLELISYDDSYEPDKSIRAVTKLINEDKVFALIGPVGTPTSKATQPIATKEKVPFIGPFTGAGFLRNFDLGNIVNVRATYAAETEAWIKHLTEDLGHKKIAILYQDDAFGRVGLKGVTAALKKRNMELVAKGTYMRNTTAVKRALLEIRKAKPEAVVMVGAYKPIAAFIKYSRRIKFNPAFVNISFVGSKALSKELGKDGKDVIISQVVPFPWETSIPLVKEYQDALKAVDPKAEPGFVSLEGYMVGKLTTMVLSKMDGEVTRESFLKTVWDTGTFDLGGITLKFGPGDNQGMDAVFMTQINEDGSFRAVDKLAM